MQNKDIDGVLPILDFFLPEENEEKYPWYVMPIAEPLEKYLAEKQYEEAIMAITSIASTLIELHERGISHRDIKPANLLVYDGNFYLGDFGLVDYPEKTDITSTGDAIGAKWTMAPEMRRQGKDADGKPADVYSLAKTLWILISGNNKGFDGQYNPDGIHGLEKLKLTAQDDIPYFSEEYRPTIFIKPLDELLVESIDDNPKKRPTMVQFLDKLKWWSENYKDFQTRNPLEWQELQKQLFPSSMPQRVIWENIEDIVYVLNLIGSIRALNHMFYPTGGGMDLEGARLGLEPSTIELIIDDKVVEIIKPKRLIFESFEFDAEWNYFRIETDELNPTGIDESSSTREELVEIAPLEYISRTYWDEGYYDDERLPSESR
jgi:serine/threonine protein kinase